MEIQKAKELRDKLQEDILSLIQQFEKRLRHMFITRM